MVCACVHAQPRLFSLNGSKNLVWCTETFRYFVTQKFTLKGGCFITILVGKQLGSLKYFHNKEVFVKEKFRY